MNCKICYFDDDKQNIADAKYHFCSQGFVEFFSNEIFESITEHNYETFKDHCLEIVRTNQPQLILLDLNFIGKDDTSTFRYITGFKLGALLRKRYPLLPIFIVSTMDHGDIQKTTDVFFDWDMTMSFDNLLDLKWNELKSLIDFYSKNRKDTLISASNIPQAYVIDNHPYFQNKIKDNQDKIGVFFARSYSADITPPELVSDLNHLFSERTMAQKYAFTDASDNIFDEALTDTMVGQIFSSKYFIADITDYNPNVMYEVGMAMALGKSIILLRNIDYYERLDKELPSKPFDIKDTYIYDYKIDGLKELIAAISRKIEAS